MNSDDEALPPGFKSVKICGRGHWMKPDDDLCLECEATKQQERDRLMQVGRLAEVLPSAPGKKYDAGKPRYDLLPPRALRAFVDVLTYGAAKYGADGWRKVVGWRWRYMRAGLTHAFGYLAGRLAGVAVPLDVETGLPELAHALCCFSFVLENDLSLAAGVRGMPDGDATAPPESQDEGAKNPGKVGPPRLRRTPTALMRCGCDENCPSPACAAEGAWHFYTEERP